MSQTPSPRHRPNFHLSLTPRLGSSDQVYQASPAGHTPFSTPHLSPFGLTSYSPSRSAGLRPPTPYGGSVQFMPRPQRKVESVYGSYPLFRLKRICTSRAFALLIVVLIGFLWWWRAGLGSEIKIVTVGRGGFGLGSQLFEVDATKDLQFFPASNPKIHYSGRWTSTPNRLRKDGTFPGVYFDVEIFNTTTILLSLRNTPTVKGSVYSTLPSPASMIMPIESIHPGHLSFRHSPELDIPAPPVSLLARVDQDEYVLLPNSSSLVSIRSNDLDPGMPHHIRIIVPMTDDCGKGIVQLEGIWLSKFGKLLRVKGPLPSEDLEEEDLLRTEITKVGEKHRAGLAVIVNNEREPGTEEMARVQDEEALVAAENRQKILEVITDSPGSFSGKHRGQRKGGADGLLAGVMGWEYLLGEMFGVDHVAVGVDGMCLMQDCIGAVGYPLGMGDVFFRSGPPSSAYFEHPWMFHGYIPDVLILNIGSSDSASFASHDSEYNISAWDFSERFEDTYVSLVNAIRRLAYPKHPAIIYSERTGSAGILPPGTPASIPIFIMRPLRGQLEHTTQGVVNRLRAGGDNAVFWLDTSGWLDETDDLSKTEDFYLDETVTPPAWRLTEQGNQRVAIFLHVHVCRYLAHADDHCAFLPPSIYQGKLFNPEEANFDRYMENDKEKKLKELFWESG